MNTLGDVLWHHRPDPFSVYRVGIRDCNRPVFADRTGFHMLCVVAGRCSGIDDAGSHRELAAGDLLIAPRGGNFSLRDHRSQTGIARDVPPTSGGDGLLAFASAAPGVAEAQIVHPLLEALPDYLTVRCTTATGGCSSHDPCRLIDGMLEDTPPPDRSVIGRLAELVAMKAIERHFDQPGPNSGFVRALRDPEIGRAIAAIHAAPGRNWSLERLATTTGLSRSAFSRRFTELAGVPAMNYLRSWRMRLALEKLKAGNTDIAHVAHQIGYRSPVAFQKAFKRVHGLTPAKAAST